MTISFVDIHCHILPALDDGPSDWDESLAMARLAVDNGTSTIIATPHQLGSFGDNRGGEIRTRVAELQQRLDAAAISLTVLAGGEARIDTGLAAGLASGDVLTLGDHRRHVLIELPFEVYLPLEPILIDLGRQKLVAVLAHPERNDALRSRPELLASAVDAGCLTQITAGSLCGTFGPGPKEFAEWLVRQGLVHAVASDGHGTRSRRPLLRRAHERLESLVDREAADELCCKNPARISAGRSVRPGRRSELPTRRQTGRARSAVV